VKAEIAQNDKRRQRRNEARNRPSLAGTTNHLATMRELQLTIR
jgi:hypothetical protein